MSSGRQSNSSSSLVPRGQGQGYSKQVTHTDYGTHTSERQHARHYTETRDGDYHRTERTTVTVTRNTYEGYNTQGNSNCRGNGGRRY